MRKNPKILMQMIPLEEEEEKKKTPQDIEVEKKQKRMKDLSLKFVKMREKVYTNSQKTEAVVLGLQQQVGSLNYLAMSGDVVGQYQSK